MKKILAIVLCATFVFGLASFASATDLQIGGDARVRGMYVANDNPGFGTKSGEGVRNWDQRVRLKLHAIVADGVEVRTRLRVSDAEWNGAKDTSVYKQTDYAYLNFPVSTVTVSLGRQVADWGNKLLVWGAYKDRLKVVTKAGATTVGVLTDKAAEMDAGDGEGDTDGYALLAIHPINDAIKVGAIGIFVTKGDDGATNNVDESASGMIIDVFTNGMAGGVKFFGEFAMKTGDIHEDSAGNSPMGLLLGGMMDFDAITASAAIGYAANKYVADDDLTPTLLVGTGTNPTAIMNFGAGDDDSAMAVVLGADYKVNDMTAVGAKLAYMQLSSENESTLTEFDVYGTYMLAEKTQLFVGLAYGAPTDLTADDNAIMSLAQKVEIQF